MAWVSLDERDNDPAAFWAYVIGAVQRRPGRVGAAALGLLRPPHAARGDARHAAERPRRHPAAELCSSSTTTTHRGPAIHEGSATCSTTCHRTLHLVLATRADPPLPLARLRARGELVEVRAADLRFTREEAAQYLAERWA